MRAGVPSLPVTTAAEGKSYPLSSGYLTRGPTLIHVCRKRRCDGLSPACTLCKDAGRECVYADAEPRRSVHMPSSSGLTIRPSLYRDGWLR